MIELIVPSPPSLNDLYGINKFGKRYKKKAHTLYTKDIHQMIALQRFKPMEGSVSMSIIWFRPKRVGDIDNYLKTISDAIKVPTEILNHKRIQTSPYGIFVDDSQVDELYMKKDLDRLRPRMEIKCWAIS